MPRFTRHDVHPLNPQRRVLQHVAARVRAGALVAIPSAAGYGLACRLGDKAATAGIRRCADPGDRAAAALLCRDLAQAAVHLHIDDRAYRSLRAAADGTQAFALRASRRVPRRLAAAACGIALLYFGGHAALQQLLGLLEEPLLVALPPGAAEALDALPPAWLAAVDDALDAGPVPGARLPELVDLDGLLLHRPSLSRRVKLAPALA